MSHRFPHLFRLPENSKKYNATKFKFCTGDKNPLKKTIFRLHTPLLLLSIEERIKSYND